MAARHIVYMRLGELNPAQSNPKLHDLPSICASLDRFGFTNPAVLDERTGRLTAGHGRREALIWMKEKGESPPDGVYIDDDGEWVLPVLRGWHSRNDTEADAYIVADNRLTESGGWHNVSLAQMVEDVVTEDATLIDAMGFTSDDVDDLLARINPEILNPGPASDDWEHQPKRRDDEEAETAIETESRREVTCPGCGHHFEVK